MQPQYLVVTFAAMAVASHNIMALPQVKREVLQPRQTLSIPDISSECQSAALDVIGSIPTPPPALVSDVAENPQTDPCSTYEAPSSLSSDYASYSSEVISWYSSHESDLVSALSACPELSSYASLLPVCSTAYSGALSSIAAQTTGTATSSTATNTPGAAGDSTSTTDNAAPRETGMALAAMAGFGLFAAAM